MALLLRKPLTRFQVKGLIRIWSRKLSTQQAWDGFDQPESWKSVEGLVRCSANYVPLSPISFLEQSANVYRDRTSIVYGSVKYTWEQTHSRCVQLASSLAQLGISHGQVVATMAPNIPAMQELHFAVPMAGGILCNLNTRHDAKMVSVLLRHSEAKIIFVDHLLLDIAQAALHLLKNTGAQVPILVYILDPDRSSPHPSNFHTHEYESLVASGDENFPIRRPKNEWDPISINYTSGTTSQPKGVVYSHRGAYLNSIATIFQHGMGATPTTPTYLWTVPMFHCHGWGLVSGLAAIGGTNICLRRVRPKDIFDNIFRHKVTHMGGAPTVLNMIVNSPESLHKQFDHKVEIMTASTSPPPQIISKMEDLGFVVSHLYGLTETHGPITSCIWKPEWDSLPKEDRLKLKARQGVKHIAAEEVKVKDSLTMETIPADGETIGEVMIRGNTVMSGYLKDPKATKEALKGGWFHTGDLAVMHTDGYIEIKDRLKDIIISGGENISSVEVESVIYSHPAVLEAAVVARPDEHWGQTVCAFVKLKEGFDDVDEEEIIRYCRDNMAHFMAPKTVVFEDLKATSTGKIQKFLLREKANALGSLSSPRFLECDAGGIALDSS